MKPVTAFFLAVALLATDAMAKEQAVLAQSGGKGGVGISAVVGGDAISSYELDNRLRFIVSTAKMSNSPEVIERIKPQVLRTLIDEKLQVQEAQKNGISISDDDVKIAIASLEQQREMQPGAITRMLEANRIPRETFIDQIRAQLAWNKLMIAKIRPQVRISDEEVALEGKKVTLPAPKKFKELKIALIQLPVEKPARETEVKRLADKLAGEIRQGASFEEVSRQFSSSPVTTVGKVEAFWVKPQQLDAAIARSLQNASVGMITSPVRTQQGYVIVKVFDARATEEEKEVDMAVIIKEVLLKIKPDASDREADIVLQVSEEVAKNPGTCQEKGIASIQNVDDSDIEVNIFKSRMSELPPAVKLIAEGLKIGDISPPFASSEGIRLYMLCNKKDSDEVLDRERIVAVLYQQKMELEAQKYMRDLRREVFTDVR
jgi:peptidyl-prolyl cis-trans isomerase SurA